ncbi:MAG: cation diffusion facilitator family transporter [Cyanobacteria bacterium J06639_16]
MSSPNLPILWREAMFQGGDSRQTSYRLLLITLWLTLIVLAVEVGAGLARQSLCLMAESLHTLIDGYSTVLSIAAVSSRQRVMGREVWGHGRAEAAGALVMAAFLGFAGVSLLTLALQQMERATQGKAVTFLVQLDPPIIYLVAAIVLVAMGFSLFCKFRARSSSSLAFKLNASHYVQDAWLSLAVLVGLVGIARGYTWLDPLLALLLTPMAARGFWRVLNAQLPMLLRPTAIAPEAIAQIVQQVEGVTRCTRILSRGMVGRQLWIELDLVLHPDYMSVADQVGEQVEGAIRDRYGPVRTQIWVEESRFAPPPAFDPVPPPPDFPTPDRESDWL